MEACKGAEKIVELCANVKRGENVVVVADEMRPVIIAESIASAARASGAIVTEIYFDGDLVNGEVNQTVEMAMRTAQVLFCITTKTMAYTKAVSMCRKNGGRVLVMTEATENTLCKGAIEADFYGLRHTVAYVKECFDKARTASIMAPGGTSIKLDITGRVAATCSGLCHNPGELIGIPDVEVYIAPIESKTHGILVADATAAGLGLLQEAISIEINDGVAVSIKGGEQAKKLSELLKSTNCDKSYVIAEFALGLNPSGELTGNIIVDEGQYGTGHFALGNNLSFGGANQSPLHLDLVYKKPTVWLDDVLFMKDGALCDFEIGGEKK